MSRLAIALDKLSSRACSRQGKKKTEKKKRFVASIKGIDDPVQHNVQDCIVRRYGMTLLWPVTRGYENLFTCQITLDLP